MNQTQGAESDSDFEKDPRGPTLLAKLRGLRLAAGQDQTTSAYVAHELFIERIAPLPIEELFAVYGHFFEDRDSARTELGRPLAPGCVRVVIFCEDGSVRLAQIHVVPLSRGGVC